MVLRIICFVAVTTATLVHSASPSVQTKTLRNGVKMPLISAGTWQYDNATAEASITAALKVGFTAVDTAFDYYNQIGVGSAINKHLLVTGAPRESLFVETKVPGCGFDTTSTSSCYNDTKRILEEDLAMLNLTYVDLVLIHMPPKAAFFMRSCHLWVCSEVFNQWRALEEFYAAGKAKAIGVSNYCPSCFSCLEGKAKEFPMVNQVSYHIGMGSDAGGFRSYADKNNMVLQAYSALGNTPSSHKPNEDILTGKFTTALAKAHNKSTVEIALKYLVQSGIPAVTKSSSSQHLSQDLDLFSWNLTANEMAAADKYHIFGMPSFACNFADEESAQSAATIV